MRFRQCAFPIDPQSRPAYHSRMIKTLGTPRAAFHFLSTITVAGFLTARALSAETYTENPGAEGDGEFTIGPDYKVTMR